MNLEKLKAFWKWFDDTDLDVQIICWAILIYAAHCGNWAMSYASGAYAATTDAMASSGVAMVIGAILTPLALVLTPTLAFLFKTRRES
jgi:hypothetical protein